MKTLKTVGKGGAPSSSKAALFSRSMSMERSSELLREGNEKEQGTQRTLKLSDCFPDPDNRRQLGLSEDVVLGAAPCPKELEESLAALKDLADNIRLRGQVTRIECYRDASGRYLIFEGERRYWALRLAGKTEVDANVYPAKPKNYLAIATASNLAREDYSLSSQMRCVIDNEAEFRQKFGHGYETASELSSFNGIRGTRGHYFLTVLNGPTRILQEVLAGRWSNIKDAYEAVQEEQRDGRPETRGRKKTTVSFGSVPPIVARHLLQRINPELEVPVAATPAELEAMLKEQIKVLTKELLGG